MGVSRNKAEERGRQKLYVRSAYNVLIMRGCLQSFVCQGFSVKSTFGEYFFLKVDPKSAIFCQSRPHMMRC